LQPAEAQVSQTERFVSGRNDLETPGMICARKISWLLVVGFIGDLAWWPAVVVALTACTQPGFPQPAYEFHRTIPVTASDPVTLDVQLSEGELQIAYGRDEQVLIAAFTQVPVSAKADKESLATELTVEQERNHLRIRDLSSTRPREEKFRIVCRIDVPYWTEVNSVVDHGKQTIIGIMGPVKARTKKGDIKVSYISKRVLAEAYSGNLDLQVIGEHVEAKTGNGNISCVRTVQGANAESENGDIVLMVVGPSMANVKYGTGRIDLGGAKGSFTGSTAGGDLQVKGVPHDDWRLNSASGNIRIELPPAAKFEVEATTNFGEVVNDRDDIASTNGEVRHLHHKVNGGGKLIEMHTDSGRIVIR
jgi:DUF4097 and DUF4098 domain-containing protein YvlB